MKADKRENFKNLLFHSNLLSFKLGKNGLLLVGCSLAWYHCMQIRVSRK